MNIEPIEQFSVKPDRFPWSKHELVALLSKAKSGDKFRATFDSEYLRKQAQRSIRGYLYHKGIDVRTQGWQSIVEFERL